MAVRYADDSFRFDEEKVGDSPLFVQRLLTKLVRRIELFTNGVDEAGVRKLGNYKIYPRKKVELFDDRMDRLAGVARLGIRNGFNLAGIIHLLDHSEFNDVVQVPAAYIQLFIKSKVSLTDRKNDKRRMIWMKNLRSTIIHNLRLIGSTTITSN